MDKGVAADGGASLYGELCALCHGERGEGYEVEGAVSLGGRDFLAAATNDFLFESIAAGRPGTNMPAWSERAGGPLSDDEIHALVRVVRGWQTAASVNLGGARVEGSPARGRELYEARCASCHGAAGRSAATPDLANPEFQEAASDGFIRHAIANGRSGTPMTAYSDELTPAEIDDLTAFVRSLEP